MKSYPILGAMALTAVLGVSSCISFNSHHDKPATTTVTRETVVPDPLTNGPRVVQTEETTTTRTR